MYHAHTMYSLLDSCARVQDYVDLAVANGQKALGITEHGLPRGWCTAKLACEKAGIKYLYGVEIYLTRSLEQRVRDNYHTILIAKNLDGFHELNKLIEESSQEENFYYVNRITFDRFLGISDNIISTSACLASPLAKLFPDDEYYPKLSRKYTFLEIQPHPCEIQREYNNRLRYLHEEIGTPLIVGTDTHSNTPYREECRRLLMERKGKSYGDEGEFNLTYKTYDELVEMFERQDVLPMNDVLEALENTNRLADMCDDLVLDTSIKYPISYGSPEEDEHRLSILVDEKFKRKLKDGVIPREEEPAFRAAIDEELTAFHKLGMGGFMLSMAELVGWCKDSGIAVGPARGSAGGSRVAYITDITDLDPERWRTLFSRFCNEDRVSIGDIDVDVTAEDRPRIFEHIISRFGADKTARVAAYGTIAERGAVDDIAGALHKRWVKANPDKDESDSPWTLSNVAKIKSMIVVNEETQAVSFPQSVRDQFPELFYYYDGLLGTIVSQSIHPAGMVISPIPLSENFGVFQKDGEKCLLLDMDEAHELGLAKYDLLIVSLIGIIRNTCDAVGIPYPKSHTIDFDDQEVWEDMIKSPLSIFQFESSFAHTCLAQMRPTNIFELSLIAACIRPSGTSYRDNLLSRKPNKTPSPLIDAILKESYGYLVYQEDIINFLQKACGLTGSQADSVRRGIARKSSAILAEYMPKILDGYCNKSDKPREQAEQECKQFLTVISDASRYSFNKSHAVAYAILGYYCAYFRHYYPLEYITSFLNNAANDDDIANGSAMCRLYGIKIEPPTFGLSGEKYTFNREKRTISKGVSSIKFLNADVANQLYDVSQTLPDGSSFMDVLKAVHTTSADARQTDILIDLDYFRAYGNSNVLIRIERYYDMLKGGALTRIGKERINGTPLAAFIKDYATDIGKNGDVLKSYTITDSDGLLRRCEQYVRDQNIQDKTHKEKAAIQMDYLGYVSFATGDPEDRRRLMVLQIQPLKSKKNGSIWARAATCRSIGSGKESRLTIREYIFMAKPFEQYDILCNPDVFKDRNGYWCLEGYNVET